MHRIPPAVNEAVIVCAHNINNNSAPSARGHEDHMDHICAESILLVRLPQSNMLYVENYRHPPPTVQKTGGGLTLTL